MWPNEFAQWLINLSGATSETAVGMISVAALVVYFVVVPSIVCGIGTAVACAFMKGAKNGWED